MEVDYRHHRRFRWAEQRGFRAANRGLRLALRGVTCTHSEKARRAGLPQHFQEAAMDVKAIDDVLAQLRAAASIAAGKPAAAGPAATQRADFAAALQSAVGQVNGTQQDAAQLARDFEVGKPGTNLQDVMVSMQKANISFQTMVQVRNRLVSAYHDMMNMQV
jgi:flagellar hook-basal body complex protein FliE